jgi:hypothetical protein
MHGIIGRLGMKSPVMGISKPHARGPIVSFRPSGLQ